ncbi:MAG: VWA domain-containing protein, partial [Opitutales bacterium]
MFAQPEWFLVLPVLALLGWQARWLCLWLPLRAMTLIMLTLVLVDVRLRTHEDGLDLWVLVDRSASAGDVIEPRLAEWEGLIRAGQGSEDQLHFVDFAAAATERTAQVERFEAQRNRTHLSSALELALNRRDESKLARVPVLTDGYPTDPLSQVKQAYREAGIPVDYRTAAFAADLDFAVEALSVPPQVQAGEPFLIEGVVSGPPQGQAEYQLLRNGEPIGQGTLGMDDGRAWLRLSARAEESGAFEYRLVIRSESDPRPGNNAFARWIEVTGGPRIVLLSRYDNDPLAGLLQQTGMRVEVLNEPRRFHEGMLNGAELIVLNDVPANEFPEGGLEAIDFFVRAQGGAMLMLGGKFSFGSGGYFESPLEEVLPVSLELKDEHRRLAIAMAIVMDRSGSMAASTGGGQTKMELANSGAAETTRLLGAEDLIAVYAVDSAAHEMVGLTTVVSNRGEIERRIRSIGSMGGGIYVFNGLQAAWNTLKTAPKGQRHVILFADAADAEQPGSYRSLIAEMRNSATTVSVIGL